MSWVMAVAFSRYGRLYYLDAGEFRPSVGDRVLVPTEQGNEVAETIWPPQWVEEEIGGLLPCAGPATDADLARDERSRAKRAEIRLAAQRMIRHHALPMKVSAVDWVERTRSATIYFAAPHRVDFRQLVRDLAKTLDCRIDLRQLGARDEVRVQGGIGPCGRETCCSTFLKDFEPVSVRMAKDQDLPVNPLRISGACGRLMCCLKYEHPLYMDFKADAPAIGAQVETDDGPGRVVGHEVPRGNVVVKLYADGRRVACPHASTCASRQAFDAAYGDGSTGSGRSDVLGDVPSAE
jgi:cell fate regulator YaaT (PSP1 superfamily)